MTCGDVPEDITCLCDEADIAVESATYSGSREKEEYKDSENCVTGIVLTNPIYTIEISGRLLSKTGFGAMHPGSEITTLCNADAGCFEFQPLVDGCLIFEDPSITCTAGGQPEISFTASHYPFAVSS